MSASAGHGSKRTPAAGPVAKPALAPRRRTKEVEFDSSEDAKAGREKLLSSGVLDRFEDKTNPKVLEEAEQVSY